MLEWLSLGTNTTTSHNYHSRDTHVFADSPIPSDLADRLLDSDGDGIPDSIQNMSIEDRQKALEDMQKTSSQG